MWFIGVEVEQETCVPPPKKNPGSAPEAVRSFPLQTPKGRPHGSCANWARPLAALARD